MTDPQPGPENRGQISPAEFFAGEQDKTKINWFCFEYAAEIQQHIGRSVMKKLGRAGIGEDDIAGFCIGFSKSMKKEILRLLAGKIRTIEMSHLLVKRCFPTLKDNLVGELYKAARQAWDDLLEICSDCPMRCISEKDAKAEMFDDPYFYD